MRVILGRAMRPLGVVSLVFSVVAGALAGGAPAAAGSPNCGGEAATDVLDVLLIPSLRRSS